MIDPEARIVAFIREVEAEYREELRAIPEDWRTMKNFNYVRAVHKASMARVLAARIEREGARCQ